MSSFGFIQQTNYKYRSTAVPAPNGAAAPAPQVLVPQEPAPSVAVQGKADGPRKKASAKPPVAEVEEMQTAKDPAYGSTQSRGGIKMGRYSISLFKK